MYDERVYFHKWVHFENKVDPNIPISSEDRFHGTAVTSIIVDGPAFNPQLEDNCGHFRVRHFGVATAGGFSSFTILKLIRDIVVSNRDIKVWNLSLGSAMEIDPDFISPEAAELDRIHNSLIVNAVNFQGKPASYTRVGPVLSFFINRIFVTMEEIGMRRLQYVDHQGWLQCVGHHLQPHGLQGKWPILFIW